VVVGPNHGGASAVFSMNGNDGMAMGVTGIESLITSSLDSESEDDTSRAASTQLDERRVRTHRAHGLT
jgi:hypothetical protein